LDVQENSTIEVPLDKQVTINYWKTSVSWSGSRNF